MVFAFMSLLAGLVFGAGLLISGMASPEKVLGFLDLAGLWDPSLALVMVGAIIIGVIAFQTAEARSLTFLGKEFRLPGRHDVDKRLIIGSLLFGAGWGLAGFCPGPALVAMGAGEHKAVVFVIAMLFGMAIFEGLEMVRANR